VTGTHKEITAKKQAEEKLRLAARVMESTNDGVLITDLALEILQVNRRFRELTGFAEDDVRGKPMRTLFSEQYGDGFFTRMQEQLEVATRWSDEVWMIDRDGEGFLARIYQSLVRDERGRPANYVAVFEDITQRKKAEEDLLYLANYDALTGLPNRTLFNERLDRAVIRAKRNRCKMALLFIDLDRFKQINDTLGHNTGDLLLQEVATRLTGSIRQEDTVARLGGDEFLIILEEQETDEDVHTAAAKILATFDTPFVLEGHEVLVGPSIGISIYPEHGKDGRMLLKNADTAMYRAKERGRGNYQIYSGEMNAQSLRRLAMETLLRKALDNDELYLVYQPKVDIATGALTGVEVLLRWQNDSLGNVSPAELIPIAEETGLIVPIGNWIVKTACRQYRAWCDAGLPAMSMAINFSARQLHIAELIPLLRGILEETGMPPEHLQLELTESLLIENAAAALDLFRRLDAMGIGLALDDFGTGYSSLSYLRRFPIDTLKVDKSFIRDALEDSGGEAIVAAIVAMAHSLNLTVVAEGVETEEQLAFLRGIDCDQYQGYLMSPPLKADALKAMVLAHEQTEARST